MRRALLPLALAALLAVVGIGAATTPGAPAPVGAVEAPVVGAAVVCPAVRRQDDLTTRVSAGSAVGAAAGSLTTLELPAAPTSTPSTAEVTVPAGTVTTGLAPDVPDTALEVSAGPPLAGGLTVDQVGRATAGDRRGLEAVACTPARTSTWFAGGSLGPGEATALSLSNPDDDAAVVDVTVWTSDGPADPRPGRGLVVPPRSRTTVALDTLAPGATGLAVRVLAERGRVAAALEHVRGGSLGADWVPATSPATRVTVPGVPAGPGVRTLLVTNPGDVPTTVSVQVTTADRQYVPEGLDALAVPAGTTVPADLAALVADGPATVTVTSGVGPVLAVALAVDGTAPVQDLAYAGAAGPLTGPVLVPDAGAATGTLALTAPSGDASVVLTAVPVDGAAGALPAPRTVQVRGGTTVAVPLASLGLPGADGSALLVTSSGGPLVGALLLREDLGGGPGTAALALVAPVPSVRRPPVRADPGAALR